MSLTVVLGALELGGIFAIMSLGLYISYKILNLPDLTVDGSFTLGCAVSAMFTIHSLPYLGLCVSFIAGALAGVVTGLLITKVKIMPLLSGILTMTALYSINLRIMGDSPNVSLFECSSIFTLFEFLGTYHKLIVIFVIVLLICIVLHYFLRTQLGLALRACGDNEDMVRASSIDTDKMKVLGLALANGFVAMGGAVFAQHQTCLLYTSLHIYQLMHQKERLPFPLHHYHNGLLLQWLEILLNPKLVLQIYLLYMAFLYTPFYI